MNTKIILSLVSIIFLLTACSGIQPSAEQLANEVTFSVTFDELDLKESTASFIVYGIPNDEEFKQIETVIVDSLNEQDINQEINVKVYSSEQEMNVDPIFGEATYNDQQITENNLVNITTENYLSLSNQVE